MPTSKPMSLKSEYRHPVLGVINITVNRRARRIIMRAGKDGIRITVPPFATGKDIENALAKHGDMLGKAQREKTRIIDSQYSIGAGNFRICLQEYRGENFMWVHNDSTATLMCPENSDYTARQEWLRKVITNAIYEKEERCCHHALKHLQ